LTESALKNEGNVHKIWSSCSSYSGRPL